MNDLNSQGDAQQQHRYPAERDNAPRMVSNNVSAEESRQTAHFNHLNNQQQQVMQHQQMQHQHQQMPHEQQQFDGENTVHDALTPHTVSDQTLSLIPTVGRLLEHGQGVDDGDDAVVDGNTFNMVGTVNYQELMRQSEDMAANINQDHNNIDHMQQYNQGYNNGQRINQYSEPVYNNDGDSQESPQQYTENRTQFAPRQMSHGNHHTSDYVQQQHHQHRNQEVEPSQMPGPIRFLSAKTTIPNPPNQQASATLQLQPQVSQSSSLMRQFSDKIKTQAERLQKLENYKKICERRILDFDPSHSLPVTEEMLGQTMEATRDLTQPTNSNQNQDYKKQLALKEQDLVYAKQRAEKAIKENEFLRKELHETSTKLRQVSASAGVDNTAETKDMTLIEQLKTLEEEKNALLDYIEESVNVTQNASVLQHSNMNEGEKGPENNNEPHRMTINDLSAQISQLHSQKSQLAHQNEELVKKLNAALETAANKPHTAQHVVSDSNAETFDIRNLPTGLSARTANQPLESQGVLSMGTPHDKQNLLSQGSLPQVQSIDYMVLDLNAVKQELMETQNQFNSTQGMLQQERQEKQDLIVKLEEAQSHIVDLEQVQLQQTQPGMSVASGTLRTTLNQNPWQQQSATLSNHHQGSNVNNQQAPDTEYKVQLVEERDRLLDQKSELQDRMRQSREENDMLKVTLDQTQHELEGLVGTHERVTKQVGELQQQMREAQELPRRLRQEAQGIRDQLDEKTGEVAMLQDEIKNLSMQAETDMDTLKQLKACNLRLESQLIDIRDSDDMKVKTQSKQWEQTITDLHKDLNDAQATLIEKDTVFQKVERELRLKLHEVEDAHSAKSTLLRRIEDLNHEVRQLQAISERKDSKIKEQTRQIEQLQFELERVNVQIQKVAHEKDATQEMRKEDFGVLEITQQKVDRQSKVINKICRDVSKVQELVNSISKEFQMPNRIQPESAVPTQDGQSRRSSNHHLDEQLKEANGFLKQIGEWLVTFAKTYKHALKTIEIGQTEVNNVNQQVKVLEGRCQNTQQEEYEARAQGKFLTTEINALKAEVVETQTLQRDGYEREGRIHKKNQQLKTQLEGTSIQKEKLQLQIKTLLGEKEMMKETVDNKTIEMEDVRDRSKRLELQISQLVEQKQSVLELFTRFKDAFPSDTLRAVFSQIIDVVKMGHNLDQEFVDTENELLNKEGQLRKYAKREVEGLLSTKVINIRKEVEQGRQGLRQMTHKRDELDAKLSELEHELKQNETIERRRTDVALETETNLTQVRNELTDTRKELNFIQRNRNDLEIALKAQQQEREMIQRELLTLRHQLQLKADLNPDNFKSAASTARKLTSYNATQSSMQTNDPTPQRPFSADRMAQQHSALRHGELKPTAQFRQLVQDNSIVRRSNYRIEERPDSIEMPVKRRFPSQEPAIYSLNDNQNVNTRELVYVRNSHHQPQHSDMPLQMPGLTDRMGDKMRPSIYGGVMSGPGAQATTAAISQVDNNKPPTTRQQAPLSSRPPTYQSTQSASKKSGSIQQHNTTSFNPLPQQHQRHDQYATGNFPTTTVNHYDSRDRPESHSELPVHTLRNTIQGTRSNSMNNLHQNINGVNTHSNSNLHSNANGTGYAHHSISQVASGDQLQPIMSQYGGEITSRSGHPSPGKEGYPVLLEAGDISRDSSPLRSNRKANNMPRQQHEENHPQAVQNAIAAGGRLADTSIAEDDSKMDANAYHMNHMSTQKSHSAYGAHRSSVNESSIHNKLSALRNVFSQIRQNLDESSMTGTRTQHQSSIDQSLIQNTDYC